MVWPPGNSLNPVLLVVPCAAAQGSLPWANGLHYVRGPCVAVPGGVVSSSWCLQMDGCLPHFPCCSLLAEEAEGWMSWSSPSGKQDHPCLQKSCCWTSPVAFHFQNESGKTASSASPLLFQVYRSVPKAGNIMRM